ncbi:MAG: radical SAM protein, partial [Nitrospinota bacterium]
MKKIAFTTLGCRFNQHETEEMEQSLRGVLQVVPFTMDADIYVINTCTVTGKSDHKCRQVIRNTAIRAPNSKLVVTGCYAETKGDELGKMAGVSLVVGNLAKSNILGSLKELYQNAPEKSRPFQGGEGDLPDAFPVGVIRNSSRRTSAYLKVQTGCDMACSYCIVSVARGKGQSNPVLNVKKGVEELVRVGVNEIVLTGINLGCYGQGSGVTLGAVERFPVKSIDLVEISPAVIEGSRFFSPFNHRSLDDPR